MMNAHGDALCIALETPAPNGAIGIPVLLWGKPGTGKSAFVQSFSQSDFPVYVLIASIHDPTDFSGLPVYDAHAGTARFAAPDGPWASLGRAASSNR